MLQITLYAKGNVVMPFDIGVQTVCVHTVYVCVVRIINGEQLGVDMSVQHGDSPCASCLAEAMDVVVQEQTCVIGPQLIRLYVSVAEFGKAAMYGGEHQHSGFWEVGLHGRQQIVHSAGKGGVVRGVAAVQQGVFLSVLVGGLFLYGINLAKGNAGVEVVGAAEDDDKVPCLSALFLLQAGFFHLAVHVQDGGSVARIAGGHNLERV